MNVAVVGGGVAGIVAAHIISKAHNVTLFEKEERLGGHTNTVLVNEGNGSIAIDTGFIVCNPKNYPLFYQFLKQLNVPLQDSDMSFGYYCEDSSIQYVGPSIREFIRIPSNLIKPIFWRFFLEQYSFNRRLRTDLMSGDLTSEALGEYLERNKFSRFLIDHYIVPLISSIWSSPGLEVESFPLLTFARFFENHGMLEFSKRPIWQTVSGGSYSYIEVFKRGFRGLLTANSPVKEVVRKPKPTVKLYDGSELTFDHIVMATHADTTLNLLSDRTDEEVNLFGKWAYSTNHAVLHTDPSVLSGPKTSWASWNYVRKRDRRSSNSTSVTYYMNRLQNLKSETDYFVTLNQSDLIDPVKTLYQVEYTHPKYTPESVATQEPIRNLSGKNKTSFCGSYLRYGFHEDAVESGVNVAKEFGLDL